MTYFGVLGVFVTPPVIALAWLARPGKRCWLSLLALVGIALLYTTPWDNYLVARGVWYYDEGLIAGHGLGRVPLEEYIFFALQTMLTGTWTAYLRRLGLGQLAEFHSNPSQRLWAAAAAGLLGLSSAALL